MTLTIQPAPGADRDDERVFLSDSETGVIHSTYHSHKEANFALWAITERGEQ